VSTFKATDLIKDYLLMFETTRDAWDIEESIKFYQGTLQVDAELGLTGRVTHESHRNRSLFTPYATQQILEAVPQ
jgi:hypothetical protein